MPHWHSAKKQSPECHIDMQVETPAIPTFEGALPEAEWRAQLEEERLQKQTAEEAAAAEAAASAEAEAKAQAEQARAAAEAARLAELAKVCALCLV